MDYRLTTLSVMLIILCIFIILVVRYKNHRYEEAKEYIDFIEKSLDFERKKYSGLQQDIDSNYVTMFEYGITKRTLSDSVNENIKLKQELEQLEVPVNGCKGLEIGKESNYQCECGSEEFTHLRSTENSGIKGEIPYNETEYQCVRCGRLHTIKLKIYGTNIQLDRVIKKES